MKRAAIMTGIILAISVIAMYEIEFVNGPVASLVLIASVISTLTFALAHQPKTEAVMAEGEETLKVKGFGIEGEAKGKRLLSNNAVMLVVACALVFGIYKHHTDNEAALARIYEAMAENTYVLSLPQAEREKLNIAIPESLRRKMRHRVND